MKSTEPLQCLIKSDKPELVSHEIILVHGFNSKGTRPAKCRRLLKSWITLATEPIRDWVNVRIFPFDGLHILHTGPPELSKTTQKLSDRLKATSKDPSSPLFCSVRNEDRNRSSRAAIFIAHGMGAWVVKDLLKLLSKAINPIYPTGLVFFDTPESTRFLKPNDVPSEVIVLQYLHEFSDMFMMKPRQQKLPLLQSRFHDIDVEFRELLDARYGKSVDLDEDDIGGFTYTLNLWTDNIWMSPRPLLKFNNTCALNINSLLGCSKNSNRNVLKKLEPAKLEEHLKRAITLHRYHSLKKDNTDSNKKPTLPTNFNDPNRGDVTAIDQKPSNSTRLDSSTDANKALAPDNQGAQANAEKPLNPKKDESTEAKKNSQSSENANMPISCHKKVSTDTNKRRESTTNVDKKNPVSANEKTEDSTKATIPGPCCKKNNSTDANENGSSENTDRSPDLPIKDAIDANEPPSSQKRNVSFTGLKVSSSQMMPQVSLPETLGVSQNPEFDYMANIYDATPPPEIATPLKCPTVANQSSNKCDNEAETPYFSCDQTPQSRSPTTISKLLSGLHEGGEGAIADLSSSAANAQGDQKTDVAPDNYYEFDYAIEQRNKAAIKDDRVEWLTALNRLQMIKYKQIMEFGDEDPWTLITWRECLVTSIVGGIWGHKTIDLWEKKDIQEIEKEARQVYEGLEKTLGPVSRDTLEALALLFVVRVPLARVDALPRAALENIQDMMWYRIDDYNARTPERLFKCFRHEHKTMWKGNNFLPKEDILRDEGV
ncbi:hypothetical protein M434DRAFT_15552 [Hypoxylon sp. CO27-5]|nr:hypothetical protein M434DRAFT_15552 [Hypoxylon sp. CO27-5]